MMKTAHRSPVWTFFTKSHSDEVETNKNLELYILLETFKSFNESW